jgi:hypothetical protein
VIEASLAIPRLRPKVPRNQRLHRQIPNTGGFANPMSVIIAKLAGKKSCNILEIQGWFSARTKKAQTANHKIKKSRAVCQRDQVGSILPTVPTHRKRMGNVQMKSTHCHESVSRITGVCQTRTQSARKVMLHGAMPIARDTYTGKRNPQTAHRTLIEMPIAP